MKKLAIGSDHAGFELKEFLRTHVKDVSWLDFGPATAEPRVDYPEFAATVAKAVSLGQVEGGVLVCGSGIGMSIAANKIEGIRAAHVESETTARLSRAHNDANILCLGSRITAAQTAQEIVQTWIQTPFEGGRHAARVAKIQKLER